MNCKQVVDHIPEIIKREIRSSQRVVFLDHIKSCDACRVEYHKYLKIYYHIDYQVAQPENEIENHMIKHSELRKEKLKMTRHIWSIAATILILILSIYLVPKSFRVSESEKSTTANSITQKLVNDEWQDLTRIIENEDLMKEFENERIRIDLLLLKLDMFNSNKLNRLRFEEFAKNKLNRKIDLKALIVELNNYNKFNSEISIREISDYLTQT
jgi:hypothetical protein